MIKVVYKDLAVGVEGNVTNTTNDKQEFVDMASLDNQNTNILNYGTLEGNHWSLRNNVLILPNDVSDIDLGYWSTEMSDDNGDFDTPITITRTYTGTYTSTGMTIEFDSNNNVYAKNVNIKWYRGATLLDEKDYVVNNATYFFQNNVIAYDKVVFTFTSTNIASRFLRVFHIYDGTIRQFYKDEIVGLEILETISDTGDEIQINTMNLDIISKSQIKMLFQRVQAIEVYNDDKLYGTFFVDNSERTLNHYKLQAYDYVGMLENNQHLGGLYNDVNANTLIADIMKDIPYELDDSLKNVLVSGYLPIDTCRNNLMQVAFSLNAVVDTSRNNKILIYPQPQMTISNTLGIDKVGNDTTEKSDAPYTQVSVYEHTYIPKTEIEEIYNDVLNGDETILFNLPYRNLSISGGTIVASGTNFATIRGTGAEVTLSGYGYEDVAVQKVLNNPTNTSNSIPNVYEIQSATLVNKNNSSNILNRLGVALFNNATIDFGFLLDDEKVGDYVTIPTDEGNKTGQILNITYELKNNKIWCSATMREV